MTHKTRAQWKIRVGKSHTLIVFRMLFSPQAVEKIDLGQSIATAR
jgi:hypothetical protein